MISNTARGVWSLNLDLQIKVIFLEIQILASAITLFER